METSQPRWRRRCGAALLAAASVLVPVMSSVPAGAADEPPPKPGEACALPARHQFDFWVGDWDVRNPDGKLVGRNRITRVHGGCALEEQWTGNGNVSGSSLNAWDADRERWHQTWVDNTGGVLLLDGGIRDGRMVMTGTSGSGSERALQRVTWQPLPDGRVRQTWEASKDGGGGWSVVFDGFYTRRTGSAPSGTLP
jgi:hypothetical protein